MPNDTKNKKATNINKRTFKKIIHVIGRYPFPELNPVIESIYWTIMERNGSVLKPNMPKIIIIIAKIFK